VASPADSMAEMTTMNDPMTQMALNCSAASSQGSRDAKAKTGAPLDSKASCCSVVSSEDWMAGCYPKASSLNPMDVSKAAAPPSNPDAQNLPKASSLNPMDVSKAAAPPSNPDARNLPKASSLNPMDASKAGHQGLDRSDSSP
jgi:hypothetical protein